MSSTNRSAARDKHIADYYVTPVEHIEKFLRSAIESGVIPNNRPLDILDPCAGGDGKFAASYPEAIKQVGLDVRSLTTIDIREDSKASTIADFLTWNSEGQTFDLIITNPPFNIALDVIKRSLELVRPDGFVVMLLRLNFFGSVSRKSFFDANMPVWSFVHHKRMSFGNTSGTDSIEYMHGVWQKSNPYGATILKLI